MSYRYGGLLLTSAYHFGVGGLGTRGDQLASSGTHGEGYLYRDADLPTENADEFQGEITTWPVGLTVFVPYEDSSFSASGADGVYSFVYEGKKNGSVYGTATVTFSIGTVTYRPASDVSAGGWTPSTGTDLFACIDEISSSDVDFIASPDLSTPCVLGLSSSMPAGAWDINYRSKYVVSGGSIRLVLLDSSNVVVGTGAWQAQTGAFAGYTSTVVTTATATRVRIEVQP